MPYICYFRGIDITIYGEDDARHSRPHIHATYNRQRSTFSIDTGQILAGKLPSKQANQLREWIAARRNELLDTWNRAQRLEPLEWINLP